MVKPFTAALVFGQQCLVAVCGDHIALNRQVVVIALNVDGRLFDGAVAVDADDREAMARSSRS
jgi:hypothetical protein